MNRLRWVSCAAALAAPCFGAAAVFGPIQINSATTIVIDPREPGPLQKAASDLASDCEKVFGTRPRIEPRAAQTAPMHIWIWLNYRPLRNTSHPSGWETLRIHGVNGTRARGVALTGSDVRGAIYAVYQFARQFLGVDPLYWWTDHEPARRAEVDVPDGFSVTEGPVFHHRGWFINDEDLFTGWKPGVQEGTGISLELWDRIFEAILRLKGDMVVPGTWIFPYEPQIRAAAERGLIVTQHHVNTLGLDTYRWPNNKPMSFLSGPKSLEAAWSRAASQYPPGAEILWSVGFRGQNDYPFWQDDPNAPGTDEGRAAIIRAAIDKQIEIVRRRDPHAEILMNGWREAATFIHEGVLKIPDGVTLVWPDNGHGILEDIGAIAAGQGEYYHTAMYDYMSNHYSEMVPLARIQRELGRAARAGATQWLLVNTANVRPVVMTTRAVMELAWNPQPWMAPGSQESERYLERWSHEEFGPRAAPSVEESYRAYFDAPARYGEAEDATAADNFYQTAARWLLLFLLDKNPEPLDRLRRMQFANPQEFVAKLLASCQAAEPRWAHALALAEKAKPLVAADRADFFQAHVLTQIELHLHFNRMLVHLAEMAQAPDNDERIARLREAIAEGEAGVRAMHDAEYGKWRGYYTNGDWLLNTPLTLALCRTYLDSLEGRPVSEDTIIRARDGGFAYHMITAYQGTEAVQF